MRYILCYEWHFDMLVDPKPNLCLEGIQDFGETIDEFHSIRTLMYANDVIEEEY